MPTRDKETDKEPITVLKKAYQAHQQQPWYSKTIHAAVVMLCLTLFIFMTSRTWEFEQEGYLIGGMAIVMLVYAFGGDGLKLLLRK